MQFSCCFLVMRAFFIAINLYHFKRIQNSVDKTRFKFLQLIGF